MNHRVFASLGWVLQEVGEELPQVGVVAAFHGAKEVEESLAYHVETWEGVHKV